jgi:hypothetical protein
VYCGNALISLRICASNGLFEQMIYIYIYIKLLAGFSIHLEYEVSFKLGE